LNHFLLDGGFQVGDSRSVLGKKKDESSPWESLELTTDHKPDLPKDRFLPPVDPNSMELRNSF
jgi:hypothetical protein